MRWKESKCGGYLESPFKPNLKMSKKSTGGFSGPFAKSRWQEEDEDEDVEDTSQNLDVDQALDPGEYGSRNAKRRRAEQAIAAFDSGTQATGNGGAVASGLTTAADRALAEIEEFKRLQAELHHDGQSEGREEALFMNPSPDVSSPEEDMHIKREGNSPHEKAGLVTKEEMSIEGPTAIGPQPAPMPTDGSLPVAWYPEVGGLETSEVELHEEDNHEKEEFDKRKARKDESQSPRAQQEKIDELDGRTAAGEAVDHYQVSMLNECRSVDIYEKLNRISEGTYGVVYRARNRLTGKICALKRIKLDKERDGFPLTSVREINILLSLSHPSIVNVSEVVVGSSLDSIFMVMEYADHDLKSVMDQRMKQPFSVAEVKCLMLQLLSGVAYLHANWVIHRDLKTSNILYTNRGELKICDFGLARQYGEPLKPYTHLVVTLWYRAPELLLGARTYSTAVDVWSCGCIMAELLAKSPLFQGKNELGQLDLIFKNLGFPSKESWPGVDELPNYKKFKFKASGNGLLRSKFPPPGPVFDGRPTISATGFDLLTGLLDLCPEKRLTAAQALDHPWFREHPLPKDPSMMPTFPGTNE